MYVYVKDGKIFLQSEERIIYGRKNGFKEFITDHKITDRLIYEGGEIKKYEHSKQYIEDTNRYKLQKDLKEERRKNAELLTIANAKVKKEMRLDVKGQEPDAYHRKLYILNNMRGSQHSGGTETESNSQSSPE